MSDTTYMTDFMEKVLKEEYDRHVNDCEADEFFYHFCYANTALDKEPTWSLEYIKKWVKNVLEEMGGFDDLPLMMQHAIYRDIDLDHLAEWISKEHEYWWLDQNPEDDEGEEAEEEDVKDPIEPVPALPPRDCRVDDPTPD